MTGMVQFVTWLGIFGIPSIFSLTMWCVKKCNIYTKQLKILMAAQKAQMRAQLLKDYGIFMERGSIMQIELDEWENQYQAYHQLVGPNGILDDRRLNLFKLPIKN